MVRFSPIALNFGYDFVLLELFFLAHMMSAGHYGTPQTSPLALWDIPDVPLDPLGPSRPTPSPPWALNAHPLTSWDPVDLPLDPLGPWVKLS